MDGFMDGWTVMYEERKTTESHHLATKKKKGITVVIQRRVHTDRQAGSII